MTRRFSNSQIDRLGERLRQETYGAEELKQLDEYRRTFGAAYDRVVERIHGVLGVPVSGRPAKSTTSIIEKLPVANSVKDAMPSSQSCRRS